MNILDWHQWGLEDRMQEWLKINYAPPICLHSFAVELRHTHSRVFLALSFFLIVLVFEHSVQNTMTLYWHVFLIVAYGRQNGSVSNILTRDGSRYIFLVYIYYQYYHYYNIIITIYTHTLYNCMYVYIYINCMYSTLLTGHGCHSLVHFCRQSSFFLEVESRHVSHLTLIHAQIRCRWSYLLPSQRQRHWKSLGISAKMWSC